MKLNIMMLDAGKEMFSPAFSLDLDNYESEIISVEDLSDYLNEQREETFER